MYINADSINQIVISICNFFNIDKEKLYKFLTELAYENNEVSIDEFIEKNVKYKPDKVMIYHLTRRLNSTDNDNSGYNLIDLLTTENAFSKFLKKHNLLFIYNKKYIEIYYKNKLINLFNMEDDNSLYLRSRLGYNKLYKDFCFNGFILNPLLGKNCYISSLEKCPEIIDELAKLIDNDSLIKDYTEESKYFCLKYLVPIQMIIIDGKEQLSDNEKKICILREYIRILINYFVYREFKVETYMLIRFDDFTSIESKYFVDKFEIVK